MVENTENNLGDGDTDVSTPDANFNKKQHNTLDLRQYYETVFNILKKHFLLASAFLKTFFTYYFKNNTDNMSRRPKRPEPIGPLSLLKSVRDQIQIVQEKRGITPDENNFINLLAVILQQSGNAMYAVFTMFMALLPVGNIIIHTVHFMLERLIDIMTTRKRKDLWVKGGIFIAQSICIYLVIHFVLAAIFVPIFAMQTTIVSKILFMEDTSSDLCQAKAGFTFQDAMPVQPPMIKPVRPKPSLKDILCPVLSIKNILVTFIMICVSPF